MAESMLSIGPDPNDLPTPSGKMSHENLPVHVRPWKNSWSAGQGIELIDDVPRRSPIWFSAFGAIYVDACQIPDMSAAARFVDEANEAPIS